jgi:SsrA-binding protein
MKVTPPPVKLAAQQLGLEVYQPERIRAPESVERLKRLSPDVLVVVAYGQIIPPSVLSIPKLGAVNVHGSLLPRHRGAAPVAHAILAGDRETGVTIMRMDEQLDHGPTLATRKTVIDPAEDAVKLTARLAEIGAELLVGTLARIESIKAVEQDHSRATLAPRLRREDGELEWEIGALELDRRVRALQPWPGVTLPTYRGRVKVLSGPRRRGRCCPMPERDGDRERDIAVNRRAYHDYFIDEKLEAGIMLTGSEVKSVRNGRANLRDGFVRVNNNEAWLENVHISPYEQANVMNVEPVRPRKLLLHKKQIASLIGKTRQKGYTLIPLRLYFNRNHVKVEVGLARGKKEYDKREAIAERDAKREIARVVRRG